MAAEDIAVAASRAWDKAWSEGYVRESVSRHASADFWAAAGGAIVGLAGGFAGVLVLQTSGAAIGGGLATYISGGNPAAAIAGAQLGANIGRVVGMGALQVLGLYFLVDYVVDRFHYLAPNSICAYDLIVNQAPVFAGEAYNLVIDMAARQLAEVIGVLCGMVLTALVLYATHRIITAKSESRPANLSELAESKLNKMSDRFIAWLIPRLSELRARPAGPPKLTVIEGGLPSSASTPLEGALKTARRALVRTVDSSTGRMSVDNIGALDRALTSEGFKLISAEPYGPEGGYQLFYQNGQVLVRFKTMGDAGGPRFNQPHLSIAYNDGRGLAWQNDLAKFDANGKVMAKVITDAKALTKKITDFQGNPRRMELIPQTFEITAVDEWAARVHFNANPGFGLRGLADILGRAPNAPKARGWTMPRPTTGIVLPHDPPPPGQRKLQRR